jgi:hypothetical protein
MRDRRHRPVWFRGRDEDRFDSTTCVGANCRDRVGGKIRWTRARCRSSTAARRARRVGRSRAPQPHLTESTSLVFVSPVFLAIVLVPAAVASVSTFVLARNVETLAAIAGAGLLLAAAFVLVVYFRAPPAQARRGCSDCGLYLGRWWEPGVVLVVAIVGVAGWVAGAGTGALARRLLRR